ncbi:protein FRG1-like [Littorina saxatilis]|uniref:Protein FRG1 homolog n=1 Tax=Littorina saxatilis TaxID=31220 RepID=A0AAN9B2W0_9CAEN
MADSYSYVKGGKLTLKGSKHKKLKKHKHKKRKHEESSLAESSTSAHDKEDTQAHGGWWEIKNFDDITGNVAFEIGSSCYISSLDNGLLAVGPPRDQGDPPDPTEVFTVLKLGETKVAFKSGYDKYLGVDMERRVVGRSEAIANREQFEPVFQEGKMALNGCNNCFMSVNEEGDVVCMSSTAGDEQMIKLRSSAALEEDPLEKVPKEERGTVKDSEINYVKKFQSFQDRRLRVNQDDRAALKKAKHEGDFHETLLDRRAKMKADRYCK